MLSVQNLSLTIGKKTLLSGIEFTINPGEIVALCGESGSGKTLTALSMMRLIRGGVYTGKILWNDFDLLHMPDADMQKIRGKEISYIFQEPGLALNPTKTVEVQIKELFTLHPAVPFDLTATLVKAGLDNIDLARYPHQLSGGQKQRVVIAMALALSPKLIIADEPTTALDRHLQKHIINILKDRPKKTSVLLITHDISVVKDLADRLIIMKDGVIVEHGKTATVLKSAKHPYTKKLIAADPPGAPISVPEKTQTILSVEHLSKSIFTSFLWRKKETVILQDVSFVVPKGHALGIIGESGSGKTTVAKIIVNIMKPTSGSVLLSGRVINNLSYKDFLPLRRRIQYIFQDPYTSLNPRMTVEEILREATVILGKSAARDRGLMNYIKDKIFGVKIGRSCDMKRNGSSVAGYVLDENDRLKKILEQVGLDASALPRFPNQFSGGQRQRIAIARALLLEPELLILDEPTSALDRSVQKNILLLLKDLQQKKNLTYIFISHDLQVIKSICHDVVVLKDGAVVEFGKTEHVFDKPSHPYTQLLLGGF